MTEDENIYRNGTYLKLNKGWGRCDSEWEVEQVLKLMCRNNIKVKNIADVGCGVGKVAKTLSSKLSHLKIDCYDISPQLSLFWKKIKRENICFFLKDFLKSRKSYDLILLVNVIEHLDDYRGYLRKIRDRSKYKILHIPLDLSMQMLLRESRLIGMRKEVGHIHYFSKNIALALLEELGYEVIDYFYTPSSIELKPSSVMMTILKPIRKIFFLINKDLTVKLLGGYSLIVLMK